MNISTSPSESTYKHEALTGLGGIDQNGVITTGPRKAIEAEVQAALEEMGSKHFILGAGCAVVGEVPAEHFVWARQTAVGSLLR
jgi:uroporphyrinogen-III decarboxylase